MTSKQAADKARWITETAGQLSSKVKDRVRKGRAGKPYDQLTKDQVKDPAFRFDPLTRSK